MTERLPLASGDLAFARYGTDGPTIVALHGAGADHLALGLQVRALARSGFRVLSFDLPGSGGPQGSVSRRPFDIRPLAADIALALRRLDALPAGVFGHSLGSALAQEVALAAPDGVRAMALVCSWGRSDAFIMARMRRMIALARLLPPEVYAPMLVLPMMSRAYWQAHEADVARMQRAMMLSERAVSRDDLIAQLEACLRHDALERLAQLEIPTLVIAGERDENTPLPYGRELASTLPRARLLTIKGESASHLLHVEVADTVNESLVSFFRSELLPSPA